MKHENDFLILAADTKEKMVSLGAASKTSTDRFDKCIQLLAAYLERNKLDFSLEAGLEWLSTMEHSPSKVHDSSYTIWSSYRRTVYLLADNLCGRLDEWRMYKFYDIPFPPLKLICPSCLNMNVSSIWKPMHHGPSRKNSDRAEISCVLRSTEYRSFFQSDK